MSEPELTKVIERIFTERFPRQPGTRRCEVCDGTGEITSIARHGPLSELGKLVTRGCWDCDGTGRV